MSRRLLGLDRGTGIESNHIFPNIVSNGEIEDVVNHDRKEAHESHEECRNAPGHVMLTPASLGILTDPISDCSRVGE